MAKVIQFDHIFFSEPFITHVTKQVSRMSQHWALYISVSFVRIEKNRWFPNLQHQGLISTYKFPSCTKCFQRKFLYSFWTSSRFWCHIMLFETITLVRRKVLHFSFVVFSLILRVYLTYLIIFSLANDNTKFWIIFLQKYSSKCYVHHMRVAL